MTILSAQTIRRLNLIDPKDFSERTTTKHQKGTFSHGLSACGYDLRLDVSAPITVFPHQFRLVSAMEYMRLPHHVVGKVHDKSSWARKGLMAQNTVIEPGWEGYLTLELTNHSDTPITLYPEVGICQVVFSYLDEPTEQPYDGKYQNQKRGPQEAL